MASAGKAVKQHCSDCLGVGKGERAFDCQGPSCPLYRCSPFRGKILPVGQRPQDYDEAAEVAKLSALARSHPKRQPSGALCTAMCRECMGVRMKPGMPDEQKGGGGREDCGKQECAIHPWHPYQPGGRQRRTRPEGDSQNPETLALSAKFAPKAGVGAHDPPVEPSSTLSLQL